jgi:hypothetical protein
MVVAGRGASKLLLLCNSSKFMDKIGEAPTQTLQLPDKTICDLGKWPYSYSKKTSASFECVVQAPLKTLSRKDLCTFLLTWL